MFKPLPNNIAGTVSNNTRYATQLVVSQNIYDAVSAIAGDWTYLCLIVGKELEVVKVIDAVGANTIQVVRGIEGTKRLVLNGATVKYIPTISSLYDIAAIVDPIEILGVEGVTVDGHSIIYPRLSITSGIDGIGIIEKNNSIIIADVEGYIGCKEHICPGEDTIYALILTSRPYPIVAIEYMQSIARAGNGFLIERVIESLDSQFALLQVDIYGGLKAYALSEAMESSVALNNVSIYGGLVSFSLSEAIDSSFVVVSAEFYGGLVSYSLNESIDSSFAVISGVFT